MRLNMSNFVKNIAVAVTCVYLTSVLAGCGAAKPVARQDATAVKGVQAATASITTNVEYSSKLKPIQEIAVSSKIAGKVASINADVGSEVKKGQVLFTLEANDTQAQLKQQEANQANTDASSAQQITTARQAMDKAQVAYNDAKTNYDKTKSLLDAGATSSQAMSDAQTKLNNAQIDLQSAKDNLQKVNEKNGSSYAQAAAAVDVVSAQLDNSTIAAPISGTVSVRNIDIGEISAGASNPAFTVIDTSKMVAEVDVPDKMVAKLKKGDKLTVIINALDNKSLDGTVDFISPAADSKTQFYAIKVNIDNGDNSLKPGMFAKVILPAESKQNVVTVPNEAIKIEDGVAYVYKVDKNVVAKTPVKMGLANEKITEITDGIKNGDFVITEGQIFLNNGQKVTIAK
jgi:HlyD family secretion protein